MKRMIQKFLWKRGWELRKIKPDPIPEMWQGLQWLVNQNIEVATVLDVGASNGCWSKDCMKYYPDAVYVLYEPLYLHADSLDRFQQEAEAEVRLEKRAVGESDGETLFDASDLWGGGMLESEKDGNTVTVPMTTIDSSLKTQALSWPYLLKLDTHGFERGILEGAKQALERTNALIIECYNFEIVENCCLFWEICAYLKTKGFRPAKIVDVLDRKLDGAFWQMDIVFVRDSWKGFGDCRYAS